MPVLDVRETSWRYSSTVNAQGFAADRVDLEFHQQAADALLATAEAFNQATLQDVVDIYVTVAGQRTLLFSGIAKEWSFDDGPAGSSGAITAEDERGSLLDRKVPAGFCLKGTDYDPSGNSMGPSGRTRLHFAIQRIADLAGLTIDPGDAPNYLLGQDIAADAEMTLGSVLARLLRPLQQVRRGRWDLVRLGPRAFRISQRPLEPTGGYLLPRGAVKLRKYRRSYVPPISSARVVGAVIPAATEGGMGRYPAEQACDGFDPCGGPDAPPVPPPPVQPGPVTECIDFSSAGPGGLLATIGRTCITRIGDRTIYTETNATNYAYAPDTLIPVQSQERKYETFDYDGDGRLWQSVAVRQLSPQPPWGGWETVSRTTKTIAYDPNGRIRQEGMTIEERVAIHPVSGEALNPPQLMIVRGESITKVPAGPGTTYKTMDRWRIGADDDENAIQIADPPVRELSAGDARPTLAAHGRYWPIAATSGDAAGCRQGRWQYSDPLIGDKATLQLLAALAQAQGNKWLVEIDVQMPLDPTLTPGRVLTMTGGALVDVVSFYITEVTVSDSGTAEMTVRGEVFLPGPPDPTLAGNLNPRAGFPMPSDLQARSPDAHEVPRFQSGIVTGVNADGSVQVYVVEEGILYPRLWMRSGTPLPRDRITVERRGVLMWGYG